MKAESDIQEGSACIIIMWTLIEHVSDEEKE